MASTMQTCKAIAKKIRISPRKLNLQAKAIRGLKVGRAIDLLTFSQKRCAIDVKKALMSAISNAENNHDMDIDRLFVSEAYVGQGLALSRFTPRAKGRASPVKKYFSHLTIVLREQEV